MLRSSCLICESSDLSRIIDLGMHPFADTFIPESRSSEPEILYPLACDLCNKCGQIQTSSITNPSDRYISHDYSYTSSNSSFSREHWEKFANDISKKVNLHKNSFVVEVGSNDGYLSEQFLKMGNRVIGVDPSPYMAELADKRQVKTIVGFFGQEIGEKIIKDYGKADLVIANNVFNHSNNPVEFAHTAAALLAPDGNFVFELPYWKIGLNTMRFDHIYHEHVSYFTATSSETILDKVDLCINSIAVVDYHGGSLRVVAQHKGNLPKCLESKLMIEEEKKNNIFEDETYKVFMKNIISRRNAFLHDIYGLKKKGESIIAVGAAAKGNTFLNFYNLDHSVIDFVTDSSPHKQGKYTPLSRIPICSDEVFSKYDGVFALILSWNISTQLKEILYSINPKIKFI